MSKIMQRFLYFSFYLNCIISCCSILFSVAGLDLLFISSYLCLSLRVSITFPLTVSTYACPPVHLDIDLSASLSVDLFHYQPDDSFAETEEAYRSSNSVDSSRSNVYDALYDNNAYGYQNLQQKDNTNVQIFARENMPVTITDLAYTDTFRGGSSPFSSFSSSFSSPSTSSSSSPSSSSSSFSTYNGYNEPYERQYDRNDMSYTTQPVATGNIIDNDDSKYATYNTDSTYGSTYTGVDSTDIHGQSPSNSHSNTYGNQQFQETNINQNLNHDSYNSNPYNNQNQNLNPNQNSFHQDSNYNNNMIRQDFSNMGMRKTFIRGKTWEEKKSLVQSMSAFGHLPGK